MNRWKLAALAAVLACALGVSAAWATDYIVDHPTTEAVKFRVQKLTALTGEILQNGVGCVACSADSATSNRLGAVGAMPLDTTGSFLTSTWNLPHVSTGAATDSSQVACILSLYDPSTLCVSGADSMYVAVQGSVDGLTWVTLRTFTNGTISTITSRLPQTNVAGTFQGLLSMNGASLANGQPVWRYTLKDNTSTTGAGYEGVDRFQVRNWPLIRFIIGFPDAFKYGISGSLWHPSATVAY